MKTILSVVITLKGDCAGITSTQIERTDRKALYRRSDGYCECFYVKETNHSVFINGGWKLTEDTIERYPCHEDFGKTAWCGKESAIRERYNEMK